MSMKNSSDTIGNRTSDLPACSAVPQPNAPPCGSFQKRHVLIYTVQEAGNNEKRRDIFINVAVCLCRLYVCHLLRCNPNRNLESRFRKVSSTKFYVLLTVHLGPILVNNQLDAHFLFCIYLYQFSTCFEHPCAHHQDNQ
jgi:hypothetical protein